MDGGHEAKISKIQHQKRHLEASESFRQYAEPHISLMKQISNSNNKRARTLMRLAPDSFLRL